MKLLQYFSGRSVLPLFHSVPHLVAMFLFNLLSSQLDRVLRLGDTCNKNGQVLSQAPGLQPATVSQLKAGTGSCVLHSALWHPQRLIASRYSRVASSMLNFGSIFPTKTMQKPTGQSHILLSNLLIFHWHWTTVKMLQKLSPHPQAILALYKGGFGRKILARGHELRLVLPSGHRATVRPLDFLEPSTM
jgi:hypothetical protein